MFKGHAFYGLFTYKWMKRDKNPFFMIIYRRNHAIMLAHYNIANFTEHIYSLRNIHVKDMERVHQVRENLIF